MKKTTRQSVVVKQYPFYLSALLAVLMLSLVIPVSAGVYISQIYSAYPGDAQGNIRNWAGYATAPQDTPTYPGTLTLDPGGPDWPNYVKAAQDSIPYAITNITLQKQSPEYIQCSDIFTAQTVTQEGVQNIRLNWPLLYESAGTTWTLTINYETPTPWDDGSGENQPSTTHTDTWIWTLDTDIPHLGYLLSLLRDIQVGVDMGSAPAVSDELLYVELASLIEQARICYDDFNIAMTAELLTIFELKVLEAGINALPEFPNPTGPGTGIINTTENPACCKLLADVEYIAQSLGGFICCQTTRSSTIKPTGTHITSSMIIGGPNYVYSSIAGDSAGNPTINRGFQGKASGQVAIPGVLGIVPGENWSNFITAAQQGVTHTIKNITLVKTRPEHTICGEVIDEMTIHQQGIPNIRLWWPLMYEPAGTTWTVTILYATPTLFDDDGSSGPNPPAWVHVEQWIWWLNEDMSNLITQHSTQLDLFHSLPFGTSGVPLISDEALYTQLSASLSASASCLATGDISGLQSHAESIRTALSSACITTAPISPTPSGPGTGIACTEENPACSKLQAYAQALQSREAASAADAARLSPDNTITGITRPQTATLVTDDWFYVQDQDRSSGLKVVGKINDLQPGGQLRVCGTINTNGPERELNLLGYELFSESGPLPRSLAMRTQNIGGSGSGLIPGFANVPGLWNGGLRVTVTGRVRSVGPDYCYIDDGSKTINGTPGTGLRIVFLPGIIPPSDYSFIRATGISSWFGNSSQPQPALLVGSATDMITILPN